MGWIRRYGNPYSVDRDVDARKREIARGAVGRGQRGRISFMGATGEQPWAGDR